MIITNKQFPNYRKFEMTYEGRPLSMEVGKMAELCNAAVLVRYGDTTVLVTCTASPRPKDGVDYFPLAVDFNEKLYAVGRIPGSFMRREGKPSLQAVLASRLIDRPMRPLFPTDLRNDVVIACEVLSVDRDCSPEITAMIGASAAVSISDVPFNGPIAGIVLGWDGEKYLFNPTKEERKRNRMTTTIAATHGKIVMIESEADQVPDEVMYEGIVQAHEHLQPVLDLIDEMVREVGKPKFEYAHAAFDEALFEKLVQNEYESMEYCMDTDDKNVREARVNEWIATVLVRYGTEHPDIMLYMEEIVYKLQKKIVKKWLLSGKRVDGRAMNEIRPLAAEVGLIPQVHGSGLFTRGQTQVLSIATLATLSEAQKLDTIWEEEEKRFMHHYNMPSYSTGEARASRSTNRREQGHGALVENPVAGISCGLIQDGDSFTTFIDIQGVEDFHGEMDFKVAGTKQGITAIQMDLKNDGLKHEIVKEAFAITKEARFQILDEILLKAIPEPRKELAKTAPKMIQMHINPDKIREVIGSGGKVIQKITADTGCKIDIDDDGTIYIASCDIDACRAARKTIEDIVFEPEVGALYYGEVKRIISNLGAFIELVPGKDAMCHIKDLEFKRTEKVEDVLNVGDKTWVKFIGIDEKGRWNISRKAALKERGED